MVVTLFFSNADAQQPTGKIIASKRTSDGRINFVKFEARQRGVSDTALSNVKKLLGLGPRHSLVHDLRAKKLSSAQNENQQIVHSRLNQYFNGVKVEYGVVTAHSKDGALNVVSGEYFPVDENFSTAPVLSESTALQNAITFVGAKKYSWED